MDPTARPVNGLPAPTQLRVDAITGAMGVADAAPELRKKVATFCRLNGYAGVLAAALQTGSAKGVEDPWAYTVAAYNNNLARLSHLFTLMHWAENSLRSHLDELLVEAIGPDWYRHPRDYLPPEHAGRFASGDTDPWLNRVDDIACPDGRCMDTYPDSAAFLRETSFGAVKLITLHTCYEVGHPFLVDGLGNPLRKKQAKKLLESANDSRNLVAHGRAIHLDFNTYTKRLNKLNDLLISMRFDLARALYRWEQRRFVVANDYLRRAGLSGIDAVIAAWQTTSRGD